MLSRRQFSTFPWATEHTDLEFATKPLVSIVLPVYNQLQFLKQSVDSVLAEKNFPLELIIVNDGSTEDIQSCISPYLRDSRVQLVNQSNLGLPTALNNGFKCAKGNFLSWTSADNYFHPKAIAKLANYLLANPAVGVTYGNIDLIDENGRALKNSSYRVSNRKNTSSSTRLLPLSGEALCYFSDNFINACFMFRRYVWQQIGYYDKELYGVEDYDFWLKALRFTTISHVSTEEPLYSYRLHSESLTHDLDSKKLCAQTLALVRRHSQWLEFLDRSLEIELSHSPNNQCSKSTLSVVFSGLAHSRHITSKTTTDSSDDFGNYEVKITPKNFASEEFHAENNQPFSFSRSIFAKTLTDLKDLKYFHSSHEDLHPNKLSYPLGLSTSSSESAKVIALPPIKCPVVVKMSRFNNYGAVSTPKSNKGTFLIFAPDHIERGSNPKNDWALNSIRDTINSFSEFTFVLFCQTSAQRQSADIINLSLSSNTNLRIIDLSTAPRLSPSQFQTEPTIDINTTFETSLMYTLSAVDGVLSFKSEILTASSLLEIRCEAALAAQAGVNCLAICQQILTSSSIDEEIFSTALPIPNLKIFETKNDKNLKRFLYSSLKIIDVRILEQWLQEQAQTTMAKRIIALMTC